MAERKSAQRVPELDGVRGVAAIVVVLFHANPAGWFFWGWSAVDLFFVLSGYLITTIILRQGHSPQFLKSFYLRRIFRIWPLYYLTLAVILLINHFSTTGYPTTGLVSHLLFLQNCERYFGLHVAPFVGPFAVSWSVAVEEQYYLVWPLLLLWLGWRSVPLLALALLTINIVGRVIVSSHPESASEPLAYLLLGTRGDGLAFGCFLAWLIAWAAENPQRRRTACLIVYGALLLGAAFLPAFLIRFWMNLHPGWPVLRYTGFSLFFFGLVGACVLHPGATALVLFRTSVLRWFGKISYAMYLFHLPLFNYTGALLTMAHLPSPELHTVVTWMLVVILPALSWAFLETPISRWKDSLLHTAPGTKAILEAEAEKPLPRD